MSNYSLFETSKYIVASIVTGIILGLIGAITANLFRHGISWINSLEVSVLGNLPPIYFYIITLSISAFLVHIIRKNLNSEPFHGVADSIYFAHKSGDNTDIRAGFLSTLAAFVSASGGASVGQYGPLVHFGATFGALLKKTLPFKFNSDLYIGAGVAASISAGFGAPVAGLLFAHEVILRHYSHKSLLAIATAAGVAYAMSEHIWNNPMVFGFPDYQFQLIEIISISLIAGPFYGIVAISYMGSLFTFSKLAQKIKLETVNKTIIGILSLSLIGVYFPSAMGLGTQTVIDIFNNSYGTLFLILILLVKIIATSISLNFGFFGGIFSPALLVGASAGAIVSSLLLDIGTISNFEYALVICGMAAVAGPVIGAPITMIILVIELTGSYVYGLSSVVGLAVAIGFTHTRYGASYFDLQLLKRGIDIAEGRMGLYLQETAVISFAKQNFEKVALLGNVGEAQTLMSKNQTTELVVVDEDKRFVGKVDAAALIGINSEMSLEPYVDKACTVIYHDASLKAAMEIASDFVGELIPIVDANSSFVIGVISENALFEAYLNEQQKVLEMEKK